MNLERKFSIHEVLDREVCFCRRVSRRRFLTSSSEDTTKGVLDAFQSNGAIRAPLGKSFAVIGSPNRTHSLDKSSFRIEGDDGSVELDGALEEEGPDIDVLQNDLRLNRSLFCARRRFGTNWALLFLRDVFSCVLKSLFSVLVIVLLGSLQHLFSVLLVVGFHILLGFMFVDLIIHACILILAQSTPRCAPKSVRCKPIDRLRFSTFGASFFFRRCTTPGCFRRCTTTLG